MLGNFYATFQRHLFVVSERTTAAVAFLFLLGSRYFKLVLFDPVYKTISTSSNYSNFWSNSFTFLATFYQLLSTSLSNFNFPRFSNTMHKGPQLTLSRWQEVGKVHGKSPVMGYIHTYIHTYIFILS